MGRGVKVKNVSPIDLARGLAAVLASLATRAPVRAADILPRPVIQASPVRSSATIPWNWSGWYLGGHVGAALGTTDLVDPFGVAQISKGPGLRVCQRQ
jgi:hypothetical protein